MSVTFLFCHFSLTLLIHSQYPDQILRIYRFGYICIHSRQTAAFFTFSFRLCGHCNDRDFFSPILFLAPDIPCGFYTIHHRHHDIHQYCTVIPLWCTFIFLYSLFAVPCFLYDYSCICQIEFCNLHIDIIIFYQ